MACKENSKLGCFDTSLNRTVHITGALRKNCHRDRDTDILSPYSMQMMFPWKVLCFSYHSKAGPDVLNKVQVFRKCGLLISAFGNSMMIMKFHTGQKLDPMDTMMRGMVIAQGLDELHAQSVIHRDLKPDNVLLAENGHMVLTDFGVAASVTSAMSSIRPSQLEGTMYYMAPEQLNGKNNGIPVTCKADIWALGCTRIHMLTGNPPLCDHTLVEIFRKVSVRLVVCSLKQSMCGMVCTVLCEKLRYAISLGKSKHTHSRCYLKLIIHTFNPRKHILKVVCNCIQKVCNLTELFIVTREVCLSLQ